jgi:hypothetical protein
METTVDVFKKRLNKMNTMDLEANPEETESKLEHQEVPEKEAMVETIRAPED